VQIRSRLQGFIRALPPFGGGKLQALDVRRHVKEGARSIRGHEWIGGEQAGKSAFKGGRGPRRP
jgi:hypothetical protein